MGKAFYTKPTVEKLNNELTQEISRKSKIGKEILDKYNSANREHDANAVDNAIEKWRLSNEKTKNPESLMIDALGAYFGNLLANHLNLEWMIYRDYQGSDLCVIHKNFHIQFSTFGDIQSSHRKSNSGIS